MADWNPLLPLFLDGIALRRGRGSTGFHLREEGAAWSRVFGFKMLGFFSRQSSYQRAYGWLRRNAAASGRPNRTRIRAHAELGIGFALTPDDLAARGNFCTVDETLRITDRRAGRIPTEKCIDLVKKLRGIQIAGAEIFVEAERPANMVTLRGWAKQPRLPYFNDVYKVKSLALAVYPMYKGLAAIVGMNASQGLRNLEDQLALEANWKNYNFFFCITSTRIAVGRMGTSRPRPLRSKRWMRSSRAFSTSGLMCSSVPVITARQPHGRPTPGTLFPRCFMLHILAAEITSRASARASASRARSANFRPST